MRALIPALVGALTLAASAQAAPLAPYPGSIELGAPRPVELVRDGCGRGWHRTHWRDQWGNWHWSHCIPNGGPHDAWSAGWYYPPSYWRGAPPSWGSGY